jgi:predicted AlkP superfamily phosphohydrolase/phosphomutase
MRRRNVESTAETRRKREGQRLLSGPLFFLTGSQDLRAWVFLIPKILSSCLPFVSSARSTAPPLTQLSGCVVAACAAVLLLAQPAHAYIGPGAGFAVLSSFLGLLISFILSGLTLLTWPVRYVVRLIRGQKAYGKSSVGRLIIVGLDGLEPSLAARYMEEGKLPNLARLKSEGTFVPLTTTTPAISPVAWSSFTTGTEPSKHNIFDFLGRDSRTYLPVLSSASIGQPKRWLNLGRYRIPLAKPSIRGMRKSVPFWKTLGDHGIHSTILRIPITFPPEPFHGHLLSGMCVPDLKGSQGSFMLYTSDPSAAIRKEGGATMPVTVAGNIVESYLPGPENTLLKSPTEMRLPMAVELSRETGRATLHVDGQEIPLMAGTYSPWIRLTFRPAPGFRVRGIARFLLRRIEPHFELYVTPINLDPERPALPISHPSCYSTYLAKLFGPFVTLGLANDTWALNEGALSEKEFLDQAYLNHGEWEKIFFNAIDRVSRGVVACHFETTDSIQHMFFRYLDPEHPSRRALDSPLGPGVIEDLYRRMDGMMGRLLARLKPDDAVVVMSDHGFKAFRRGVNLNAWLQQNGYLSVKGESPAGDREWLRNVDWAGTRAYAFGLGGIFLNVKGREAHGIVEPGRAARALAREMADRLETLTDDGNGGRRAVNRVVLNDEIAAGPYRENSPELIVGFAEGYRASWDSAKGVVTGGIFEDNTRAWSGDHCMDPSAVPGVYISNRRINTSSPRIWDIAPTALSLFGINPPKHMDGRSLIDLDARAGIERTDPA